MNVTLPNGKVIENVPEGTSKEEIKLKAIEAGIATEADFLTQEEGVQDASYFERVSDIAGRTVGELQTMADPEKRMLGRAPGIYTPVATAARGVGGILVETGKEVIPEDVSFENMFPFYRPLMEPLVKLGKLVSETDLGSEAIEIAKRSYTDYQNWKQESEENAYVARELESMVDVGSLFAPSTRVAPITPDMGEAGRQLSRAGRQQKITKRQDALTEIITPVSGFGEGKTITKGLRGKRQYIPTADEKEMVRVLSKIPEIKVKDTMINNYNAIDDAISSKANKIITGIAQTGNPKIDVDQLVNNVRNKFFAQVDEKEVFNLEKQKKKADEMLTALRKFAGSGTSLEVLEARKKLDAKLREDEYDPDSNISKASIAGRKIIAEAVHTALQDALSTGGVRATLKKQMPDVVHPEWIPNVKLKELLREQHLLYRARDVVDEKRKIEDPTAVGRQVQNLERAGFNPPKTAMGQGIAAGVAYKAATSPAAPYVVSASAAIGTMYGVGKLALSSGTKKVLGQILQTTDKALRSAKITPEMAAQLRADRLVIISLLNQPTEKVKPEEQPEEQEEPQAATQQTGQAAQIAGTIQNLRGFNQLPPQQVNARLGQLNDPLLQQAVMQQLYGTTP